MIILSNCLTETPDEGCLKVANSFVKKIKKAYNNVTVVSYERKSEQTDIYLPINKLLLNNSLRKLIAEKKEPVLYIPFPAKMISTAIRVSVLSLFARNGLRVLMVMRSPMNFFAKWLFRFSRAELVALSRDAYDFYKPVVGEKVSYLKAGVDTERFVPVDKKTQICLKNKYGLPQDKPVVLHVGHMKSGRNIAELLKIKNDYHIALVVSTLTKDEQDIELRKKLESRQNITIIDDYIPNIEEIHQMADVYFFPVAESGNCIDIPLSVMEAAACNKPIVTTAYGEIKEVIGNDGFYLIDSFDADRINVLIDTAIKNKHNTRNVAMQYDWNSAIADIINM